MSKTEAKPIRIIARYWLKKSGHIVYKVEASDGQGFYCTTVIDGHATGCTCPGHERGHRTCKHMVHCEEREAARTPQQVPTEPTPPRETPHFADQFFTALDQARETSRQPGETANGRLGRRLEEADVQATGRVLGVLTGVPDGDEYERWKRETGRDRQLSRAEYCEEFGISA
jgi:hypothetical protein